ncbi:hypothetical protein AAKU55_005429 [Oxalobacteraceae bacterium GrIS 1.11]
MEMYFAVDELAPDFASNLLDAFHSASLADGNLSMYALIDASFEYVKSSSPRTDWKNDAVSLYRNTIFDALKDAAPHLVKIHDDPNKAKLQLRRLFKICNGFPMVSFIASNLNLNALAKTFEYFLEINIVDEQKFLLRFADTRLLPLLDIVIRENTVFGWRQGVSHWWLPNRNGELDILPVYLCDNNSAGNENNQFSLPQISFNKLVDAGESDAIIDVISDQNIDILKINYPSNNYAIIQRLREKMLEFNIENFPDMVIFCTTALATSEEFYLQADFNLILKSRSWKVGKLGDAFSSLNDSSWAEIETEIIN